MHGPDQMLTGIVIAIPVVSIAFLLYRVLRHGYAIAPWQENADQRFGSKNYEPPIELKLNHADESDPQP